MNGLEDKGINRAGEGMKATERQARVISRLSGRTAAVLGLGRSNIPLVKFLVGAGVKVTACDAKPREEMGQAMEALAGLDVEFRFGPDYLSGLSGFDMLFPTPGMRLDLHEIEAAVDAGVELLSEMKLMFELCEGTIVGITGSNGKTTTTTLTGLLARKSGRPVYVGGNIGRALIGEVLDIPPGAVVVMELSSFQLKPMRQSPSVGAVLNVYPNHLDVHPDMEDYIESKRNIVRYQTAGDVAVLNLDNEPSRSMAKGLKSKVMFFTRKGQLPPGTEGAFLDGRDLVLRVDGQDRVVITRDEIRIPGDHNVENILAAICLAHSIGVEPGAMREIIAGFTGVEHRLELVAEIGGVRYINDSIATSPSRTAAGVRAVDGPVVLIAGGYDKHIPFDEMAEAVVGRVKAVVVLGATAEKIVEAIERTAERTGGAAPKILRAASFDDAVEAARRAAEPGDTVLLSPGCASYDMFRNFEERGARFKQLVLGDEVRG